MGYFEHLEFNGIPDQASFKPIWPFKTGETYTQVDLGSRAAVVGVAHYLLETGDNVTPEAINAAVEIDNNSARYAVYTGNDQAGAAIAYVYEMDK